MTSIDNKKYINKLFRDLPEYFLPLAVFFILISTAITNIFLVLTLATGLISLIQNKNYKIFFEKNIIKYSCIIYIVLFLSYFYTIADDNEVIDSLKKYVKFLYIPIIYYYVKIYKNENLVIKYFIKGSVLVLILSCLKYFNVFDFNIFYNFLDDFHIASIKEKIIFDNTGVFQNYLIQGIIFSFLFFLSFIIAKKNNNILLYLVSLISFINVLFLNNSRTGFILIIVFLAMIAIKYIKFNKFLIFTGVISILFITLSTNIANNFLWRVNHLNVDLELINNHDYDSSVGKRYLWMISGINNIKNKPLLGHGVGSYYNTIESYISINDINIDPLAIVSNNPHNEFISISSQIGLFGFLLFTMFFISLYKDSSKSFLTQGVFVTVLISSLFNSAFYDNILGIFLVVIIGVSYQRKKQI